jgi:hypothetical protein
VEQGASLPCPLQKKSAGQVEPAGAVGAADMLLLGRANAHPSRHLAENAPTGDLHNMRIPGTESVVIFPHPVELPSGILERPDSALDCQFLALDFQFRALGCQFLG